MNKFEPSNHNKPDEQLSKTPSGKKIPMAMSMMVESMVRMIQKASKETLNTKNEERPEN